MASQNKGEEEPLKLKITQTKIKHFFNRLKFWKKDEQTATLDLDEQVAKMSELNEAGLKVTKMKPGEVIDETRIIDLEREFMNEIALKKKPKLFKIIMFVILVILIVVVLTVIILKLK